MMNKNVSNTLIFSIGAAIGSLVTWKCVKKKYERMAQEEIDSVKKEYEKLTELRRKEIDIYKRANEANRAQSENSDGSNNSSDDHFSDDEITEYHRLTKKYISTNDDNDDNDEDNENSNEKGGNENYVEMPVQFVNGPYVISPDMLNEIPGYNWQCLTYYADDILADDWGVELDLEETIGEEALDHFGEYVDDTVYVRNERTELDYEVTRDPRTYDEAMQAKPSSCW